MAGLCGLKILLLWAGIITLANCQSPTITPTATTATPASTSPSPSPKTNNTNQNQTSPPITTSNTTVTPPTTATTPTPPPQQCPYTVTPIKFGFRVDMLSNSTTANYTINIKEKDQSGKPIVQSFSQSVHEIKHLKPCTEYELNVTFIDSAGNERSCKTEKRTLDMSQADVKDGSCMPGYVCYQSDWDISSSLSKSNTISAEPCKSGMKEFCIKPGYNDTCTDLTTNFTSEKCGASFILTKSIPVDFLDPSEINQMVSTEFPAKIKTKLPQNCNNLTIDYTCQEANEQLDPKKLSELEPFTDYICTGQLKDNNVTVNGTTAVKFRIDCDLTIDQRETTATDTSIQLEWKTTSLKCQSVLPDLKKLSYDCSCSPLHQKRRIAVNGIASGETCNIQGLEPYTDYSCEVQPKYNNKKVTQPTKVQDKTKSGKPDDITSLTVNAPEHNLIIVTCFHNQRLNGLRKNYTAHLHGVEKKENKEKCSFEFKDLSYSTQYELEVTVCNEDFCSNPKKESVATSYNDKAVNGFLVFFIIIASVVLVVAVSKLYVRRRKSRNVVNEDVLLELTNNKP